MPSATSYTATKGEMTELAAPSDSADGALNPISDGTSSEAPPDPVADSIGTASVNSSSTKEIAPASSAPQPASAGPAAIDPSPVDSGADFTGSSEVRAYEEHQADMFGAMGPLPGPGYLTPEDEIDSPIGVRLREARRTLASGQEADGLLIVGVTSGSPAAVAGLQAFKHRGRDTATVVAIAAAYVMPLAALAIPIIQNTGLGASYDMIIGVDGLRVTNFLDFQDHMREVQPGEIVYLSVVRNGHRQQFKVDIPAHGAIASP